MKESLEKLNAAKDALAAAQKDEAEAKGAYDAAESDVTEAQQKANKAASDYNAAKKLSDEKAEALKTATADRNAAYTNLESVKVENADAISTYETAAAAYEEAYSTYETARKAVVNLQPEYNNCKTALEDATDAYNAAKEAAIASNVDYAKGAAGFYKAIGATGAVNIVTKLTGVNSVNAEKYFNDQFDEDRNVIDASPLNLDNMKLSLEILKQLNELRSADKLHELEVDTNLMAFSQVATMWAQHYSSGGWGDTSSGVNGSNIHSIAHANNLGENASWNGVDGEAGVTQAMNQWYTQEKAIYDSDDAAAFRAELDRLYETDHVTINGERIPTKGNWNNCVYAISKYAEFEDIYHETGHYLNIINPSYQYMGAAYADSTDYTQWNTYEQTFDFSGNSSKFSDGQIYTVDQFVSKFNEYYDKVMGDSGNALASLESEMKNAQKKYDETNEALSKARKDRDQAYEDRKAAQETMDSSKDAYDAAVSEIAPYQEAYDAAEAAYDTAVDESEQAAKDAEGALAEKDATAKTLEEKKQTRDQEKTAYETAQGVTSDKQDAVDAAQTAYDEAVKNFGVSDEEHKKLQEAFDAASEELEDAKAEDAEASGELAEAKGELTSAQADEGKAQDSFEKADASKKAADDAAEKASQAVADAEETLGLYEDVAAAEEKLDEAKQYKEAADKKLSDAQSTLEGAEDDVTEATQEVADAQAHKDAIDVIEWDELLAEGTDDPELADAVRAAGAVDEATEALNDASDKLKTASDDVESANKACDEAQGAYDEAEQAVADAQAVVDDLEAAQGGGADDDVPADDDPAGDDATDDVPADDDLGDDGADDPAEDDESPDANGTLDRFEDVEPEAWYVESVDWAVENGVMNGYDGGTSFGPNDTLTREQAAAVLYNYLADGATGAAPAGREDVDQTQWYAEAVNWAVENGVMNGYDGGTSFGIGDALTREQFCAIIANAVGADIDAADEGVLSAFPDADGVSPWASKAVAWAVESGVIHGVDLGGGVHELQGGRDLTRAEMAAMVMNAVEVGVLSR